MRSIANGSIIGLFALRILQGQLLRRVTETIFISVFSLRVLGASPR